MVSRLISATKTLGSQSARVECLAANVICRGCWNDSRGRSLLLLHCSQLLISGPPCVCSAADSVLPAALAGNVLQLAASVPQFTLRVFLNQLTSDPDFLQLYGS